MINGLVVYEYHEKTDHPCEITANGNKIKKLHFNEILNTYYIIIVLFYFMKKKKQFNSILIILFFIISFKFI